MSDNSHRHGENLLSSTAQQPCRHVDHSVSAAIKMSRKLIEESNHILAESLKSYLPKR
jgi:hypothetical protein